MALSKQTIDFLPKPTEEQLKEQFNLSKTTVYAAILPLLAAIIWVVASLIHISYKNQLKSVNTDISNIQAEIDSFSETRLVQSELVYKVNYLTDIIQMDFRPQEFFDNVKNTIKSTGDAQAEIYSYAREDDGKFVIQGKANSYLDLAKIIVVFKKDESFSDVRIKSIYFDLENDNVNFEITFYYFKLEATE